MFKKLHSFSHDFSNEILISLISALIIGTWVFYSDVKASMKESNDTKNIVSDMLQWKTQQIMYDSLMCRMISDLQRAQSEQNDRQKCNRVGLLILAHKAKAEIPEYTVK